MKLGPCWRDVNALCTMPSLHHDKLFKKNTVHNTHNNCLKREGFYIFVSIIKTPTPPLINNIRQEMTDRSSGLRQFQKWFPVHSICFSALGVEYLLQVMTLYEDKSFVLML